MSCCWTLLLGNRGEDTVTPTSIATTSMSANAATQTAPGVATAPSFATAPGVATASSIATAPGVVTAPGAVAAAPASVLVSAAPGATSFAQTLLSRFNDEEDRSDSLMKENHFLDFFY